MSYTLVPFQGNVVADCYQAYRDGARNVMPVLPTGAGKTVIMGYMAHEYEGCGLSMAHRGELVGQMSIALAREGLRHDIIAPDSLIRTIVGNHMREIGRSFYDARAKWKVSSVDTLIRRQLPASWLKQVGVVHIDEGHHVLRDNKWGKGLSLFDNAYGLLPTATPDRADGKGLGSHADGVVDAMIEGPNMRWLIDNGYLTDYKVLMPTADDLDMTGVDITPSGEYNLNVTRVRVKASKKLVGDVVDTYLTHCRGMKGITFAIDVEHATTLAAAYNKKGVKAVVVSADTSETDRCNYMYEFRTGDLMQLVNVDLFGEGVDVPAVQVISMARPTASFALFTQQFGRALRLLVSPILRAAWHTYTVAQRLQFIAESGKPKAFIIDHVGNIFTHMGTPDMRTEPWSLDSRSRSRRATDGIPLRACRNPVCLQPYEAIYPKCPHCNFEPPPPPDRTKPEFVDGDMILYTPELLRDLFAAKAKIDDERVQIPYGVESNSPIAHRLRNIAASNKASQALLRDAMALVLPPNLDERLAQRRFFHTFGVDTLSAQGLRSADADDLRQRIIEKAST
jgi:superfamily II DNA or RNA helicase